MIVKKLSLAMACVLSTQSFAAAVANAAGVDRTAGIGEAQIKEAQANMAALRSELLKLDESLLKVQEQIKSQLPSTLSGSMLHGLQGSTLVGASLGLGLSAYATFMLRSRGGSGSGISGALSGAAAILFSVGSLGVSTTKSLLQNEVDAVTVGADLAKAQTQVDAIVSTTSDKATKSLLLQLSESVKAARTTLATYKEGEDSNAKTRFYSQIAQASGVALTVLGTTQQKSSLVGVGVLVMNAGNLGQIIGGLTAQEADLVLREIETTRRTLIITAKTLE